METRDIKTKKPWRRVRPDGYLNHGVVPMSHVADMPFDELNFELVTQADFIRELYPTGHAIYDHTVYPDIFREEVIPVTNESGEETGRFTKKLYREPVPRYAFAFQRMILVKHLVHCCGNDIQFELNAQKTSQQEVDTFTRFRTGWLGKDMEIAFYEAVKSIKAVGDTAFVGFLKNGKFFWKVLSFLNGDTIYPHFDTITGKLKMLARAFSDYNEEGNEITRWLEVWDDKYLYRYRQRKGNARSVREKIMGAFGIDGYTLVDKKIHGFPFIPVAYHRNEDGPCWSFSQDTIEGYEMSFSQMAHNNQVYGEPIMLFMGEGDNIDTLKDVNGTIKSISVSTEEKVDYLQAQSASESYIRQLNMQYKMIFSQSFIVEPPELKSGDLPAAALKILYSPAYENAIHDSKCLQPFLNVMVEIFTFGHGIEVGNTIGFANLDMKWWIEPYVHVNSSTVVADLAAAVQNGFISRQTASERIETLYSSNSEWDRILREAKQQQEADLLYQLKLAESNEPSE